MFTSSCETFYNFFRMLVAVTKGTLHFDCSISNLWGSQLNNNHNIHLYTSLNTLKNVIFVVSLTKEEKFNSTPLEKNYLTRLYQTASYHSGRFAS